MTIRNKETGREIDDVRDLIDKEMGSERLALMFGGLLKLLCDNGAISEQDAIDLTWSSPWFEVAPASLQDSEV